MLPDIVLKLEGMPGSGKTKLMLVLEKLLKAYGYKFSLDNENEHSIKIWNPKETK